MQRRRLLFASWSCSDLVHHAHRARWRARICGLAQRCGLYDLAQRARERVRQLSPEALIYFYALACCIAYLLVCAWLDQLDAQFLSHIENQRAAARHEVPR